MTNTDPEDPRWEGAVPLFLRHAWPFGGNREQWDFFFAQVEQRIGQLFLYNEPKIKSSDHFGDQLRSASHLLFPFDRESRLYRQLEAYFRPLHMHEQVSNSVADDAEFKKARNSYRNGEMEHKHFQRVNKKREAFYEAFAIKQRLTVLEEILRLIKGQPNADAFCQLVKDLRRCMAAAGIALDISSEPICIRPLDQPLLDREVIQRLLPMLAQSHPDLERDLVSAYHGFLQGIDSNTVFGNAFKVLEELAKRIAKQEVRLSDDKALIKHFGKLHPTIHATIIKLAAHRGKEGGHNRQGPDHYEMRYLLFSICNCALLLLEYASEV